MTDDKTGRARNAAFAVYLRTGRRLVTPSEGVTEIKFNPWHDPEDGRFTFAGRGRYYGAGTGSAPDGPGFARRPNAERARRLSNVPASARPDRDPRKALENPVNAPIYAIRPGDSLTRIAANRKGLSVSDLAWINGIPVDGVLKVGQKLKVPTQAWLDSNKARMQDRVRRLAALEFYLDTHGNKLPVPRSPDDPSFRDIDSSKPPSIEEQLDANLDTRVLNGYSYAFDKLARVRNVRGDIPSDLREQRSRRSQANAGGKDRLPTDDGGHYVAPGLGGSPDPINHFPQDSGINRGQYRIIEKKWHKARDAGQKVSINITPRYRGTTLRPYALDVIWYIDGQRHEQHVGNVRRRK